jgi:hypothetical protein
MQMTWKMTLEMTLKMDKWCNRIQASGELPDVARATFPTIQNANVTGLTGLL